MIGEKNDKIKFSNTNFSISSKENSKVEIFLNKIFIEGINMNASDIHIESCGDYFRIRYRVDGILLEKGRYNKDDFLPLVSRIKILCNLDITEKRIPQDGRVDGNYRGKELDFRISIVPAYFGEKVVIRILYKDTAKKTLEELGFDRKNYSKLFDIIKRKSGMLIISGPMGSGKTTSMYAILNEINSVEKNIVTIEDPVEYVIEGINQIQCKNEIGLDFSKILKSILRQDADIIMIGEIRDRETAEIAIKASLTGHLILTTLHTKNIVSAVKRLINLGVEPFMISAGVKGIQNQRLVRKLCPHCKMEDKNYKEKLEILGIKNIDFDEKIYTHKGCEKCNFTGYKDRVVIGEFLYIDNNIEKFITSEINISDFEDRLKELGINSLLENGIEFVKKGITSLDELIREC